MKGPMLRQPAAGARVLRGTTAFYADVAAGLIGPGVRLGVRCVAWPAHELDEIVAARAGGADDEQVRALVRRQIEARRQAFAALNLPAAAEQPKDASRRRGLTSSAAAPLT
jgi:predicted DNA-binding transcriptional regulator AlpA